jgi:hypothetical protein
MPYFLRFRHHNSGATSMGTHSGYLPGYPASHGCIRMPDNMAQKFYYNAPVGTAVSVEHVGEDASSPAFTVQGPLKVANLEPMSVNAGGTSFYNPGAAIQSPGSGRGARVPSSDYSIDTSGNAISIQ